MSRRQRHGQFDNADMTIVDCGPTNSEFVDRPKIRSTVEWNGRNRQLLEVDEAFCGRTGPVEVDAPGPVAITIGLTDSASECPVIFLHCLTPEQARSFAASLVRAADEIDQEADAQAVDALKKAGQPRSATNGKGNAA